MDERLDTAMNVATGLLRAPGVFGKNSTSWCYKHRMQCKVDDVSDAVLAGEQGVNAFAGLRVAGGGVICKDFSKEGDQMNFAGPSTKPWMCFVEERRVRQEPVLFQECVDSDALLSELIFRLGHLYHIECITLSPYDFGHPTRRERGWVVGVLRSFGVMTRSLAELLPALRRDVVATGDAYYVMGPDKVRQVISKRAKERCVVASDHQNLVFHDILPPYMVEHLAGYEKYRQKRIDSGRAAESDPGISDLHHNPLTSARQSWLLQTLTSHGERWNHKRQRGLLGEECMAAMCVSTPSIMEAISKLGMLESAEAKVMYPCPFYPLMNEGTLSEAALKKLAGNGMHLTCAGAMVMWTFAHLVPRSHIKALNCPRPLISVALTALSPSWAIPRTRRTRTRTSFGSGSLPGPIGFGS
jgi:hypothetical protein